MHCNACGEKVSKAHEGDWAYLLRAVPIFLIVRREQSEKERTRESWGEASRQFRLLVLPHLRPHLSCVLIFLLLFRRTIRKNRDCSYPTEHQEESVIPLVFSVCFIGNMRWQTHIRSPLRRIWLGMHCIVGRQDNNRPSRPAPQPSPWHHFSPDKKGLGTNLVRCYVGDVRIIYKCEFSWSSSPVSLFLKSLLVSLLRLFVLIILMCPCVNFFFSEVFNSSIWKVSTLFYT